MYVFSQLTTKEIMLFLLIMNAYVCTKLTFEFTDIKYLVSIEHICLE